MTPGSETDFTLSNARQFYMSIGGRGGGGRGRFGSGVNGLLSKSANCNTRNILKMLIMHENTKLQPVLGITLWFHVASGWLLHSRKCQNQIKLFMVSDSHSKC